ncbi:hypothetical protein P171DRAFT_427594 [Karstenula rhodostoma CBS 690.94]|uniref:Uncharacterized protein n=1 Tax=Karstenula rhodostoma CBS 690.94 TaxID=1392251 RepID=A0A9P4PSE9_9PLEO|nr:hypothetical protein P171DRAFT_427594 [Karstenula rhodostoma CBS 690.94]
MPSTRSGNKTASFKAYYSKKAAPHQQYFPHRRKVVRRPDPHDDSGKKQMKFLPEMMRRRGTVQDSDDEGGESVEDEEVEEAQRKRTGKKRNSDVMREVVKEEEEDEEEPVRPTPKRRRKDAPVDAPQRSTRRRRAAAPVARVHEDEDLEASDKTEQEEAPKPRLRRQSTMTQIVDGRSPAPGSTEPDFKPVKRTPRTSWGAKGSTKDTKKDSKQRTLTQMVHTMTPLVLDSDEDVGGSETTDEEVDAAYRSFIFGNEEEAGTEKHTPARLTEEENLPTAELSLQAVEGDDGTEDEYRPTRFIEAPTTRSRHTPLRSSTRRRGTPASRASFETSPKTRFGLLSTPEKRGVFEIASSQSPPETLLSTQNTPRRSDRTPLKPRSANAAKIAETPSKRGAETPSKRKQVTFQEGPQEQIPPPALKKFASTIPDSEDEPGDLSESDGPSDADYDIGEDTQALLRNADSPISGVNVGEETQSMLLDIDRACANLPREAGRAVREESEELGEPIDRYNAKVSQELGLQTPSHPASSNTNEGSSEVAELPPLPFSSPKPRETAVTNEEPSVVTDNFTTPPIVQQLPSSPPLEDFRTQTPTLMFADDEMPEEAEEPVTAAVPQPSTPTKQRRSSPVEDYRTQQIVPMFDDDDQPSEDLDDVPSATPAAPRHPDIQVFRSPPARLHPEPSHSSQAEQQLHSEYQTYSQYRRPAPFPSSMHVAHDSHYSYQATPRPLPRDPPTQLLPQTYSSTISQATTVDPTQMSPNVTPQKSKMKKEPMFTRIATTPKRQRRDKSATTTPRTQRRNRSATTTPKSQRALGMPMSSPEASKPPPLFIPSSFPSPARVTMEGWSSPVVEKDVGESQWGHGSLEEFSIPAPPPGEWVDEDEDEEV